MSPLARPTASLPWKARGAARVHTLAISYVVEGAGGPFGDFRVPFAFALGATPASASPLWFEAAQLYRGWAVEAKGAGWLKSGPISARPHAFPPWLLDTNIWVNSGWQCYDRFNLSQGDPSVVVARTSEAARLFGVDQPGAGLGPLALHWYEWQCGEPGLCPDRSGNRLDFIYGIRRFIPHVASSSSGSNHGTLLPCAALALPCDPALLVLPLLSTGRSPSDSPLCHALTLAAPHPARSRPTRASRRRRRWRRS